MTPLDDAYAPFPYDALKALAARHTISMTEAAHIANAIKCHDALRERCLLAEMELGQVERRVKQSLDPDHWPEILGSPDAS